MFSPSLEQLFLSSFFLFFFFFFFSHLIRLCNNNCTILTSDSGWVHWNTAFELPTAPHGFSFVFIYFMGPKGSLDIVVDDLHLSEIYQDPDWKAKSDVLIDRYRKRTVRLRWVSVGHFFAGLHKSL